MADQKLPVDCLIPAAGFSSRMGKWKALLPVSDGTSLLEAAVSRAQEICDRIIVVGGHRFEELNGVLHSLGDVILLENPDYEKGMLSSIQKGLEAVEKHFFITPMDMPGIGEEHYRLLYREFNGNGIVRPFYRNTPGHPILCPFRCKEDILKLKGERLITAFQNWEQKSVEWENPSVTTDIDTPEDFSSWILGNG